MLNFTSFIKSIPAAARALQENPDGAKLLVQLMRWAVLGLALCVLLPLLAR